jgi:hypothetical protein
MLSLADINGIRLICEALGAVRDTEEKIPAALEAIMKIHSAISELRRKVTEAETPQMRLTAQQKLFAGQTQLTNSSELGAVLAMANSRGFELNQAYDMILPKENNFLASMSQSLARRYGTACRALSGATKVQDAYREQLGRNGQKNTAFESWVFARTLAAVVDMAGPEDNNDEEEEAG